MREAAYVAFGGLSSPAPLPARTDPAQVATAASATADLEPKISPKRAGKQRAIHA